VCINGHKPDIRRVASKRSSVRQTVVNEIVPLEAQSSNAAHAVAAGHPCSHTPVCPRAEAADREAAVPIAPHPEQGWSLLCNGVVLFEDTGELLPDGRAIAPYRPTDIAVCAARP
jgi:Family of unknown function (DUF5999)